MYITNKLKRELVLKIEPGKYYPVSYTINQDGTRLYRKTFLKGEDLTEKQIIELWLNNEL